MFLMDNRTFCPSRHTPMVASTEMFVAFRSSRLVQYVLRQRVKNFPGVRPVVRLNMLIKALCDR